MNENYNNQVNMGNQTNMNANQVPNNGVNVGQINNN